MRLDFYPRLATDGIRKNKRMYLPYILTCSGMVMMFYIIMYLAVSDALDAVYGADTLRQFFTLGSWIIAIFSAIFLFYTNFFLMRRRRGISFLASWASLSWPLPTSSPSPSTTRSRRSSGFSWRWSWSSPPPTSS